MLKHSPRVDVIEVSRVTSLPNFHPEAGANFRPFPVNAFLIHHPDGPILVDTGIGFGNSLIDDWYKPRSVDLRLELERLGVDVEGGLTVVNTHLHFDHCGQNRSFPKARFYVQKDEVELVAKDPIYTVAEWATTRTDRTVVLRGDSQIAEGVSVLHTPGHSPGHQSLAVQSAHETFVIAGQCLWIENDWYADEVRKSNLHNDDCAAAAAASIARLKAMRPNRVFLSHDLPFQLNNSVAAS